MIRRELFAKYDVPVPRYTSYPTVPQWTDTPTPEAWRASLAAAAAAPDASLSVYVHVPFCEALCTYCGCNTVITRDHGRERPYVDVLMRELDLYRAAVPSLDAMPVRHLHLGGGTPTFLAADALGSLVDGILSRLPARADSFEGSVEADPRVTNTAHLETLAARGFARLSLGIQDFDATVQNLVNRRQSAELVRQLTDDARRIGYDSINFDLIYGLPAQTPESMASLADRVIDLRPDRLAVYSFARVPWIKPAQRKFKDEDIPAGEDKRALYEVIRERLLGAGYIELGMDHFALPGDPLAQSAAEGHMHRNFMGYAERRTSALLGLGVSAISETADCYHQNEKVITVYDRRVSNGEIPTLRGHRLTGDDRRRRERILALMTTFHVELDANEQSDAEQYLAPLVDDGLVAIEARELRVLPAGRPFLRNAAAFFDRQYRTEQSTGPKYSSAV